MSRSLSALCFITAVAVLPKGHNQMFALVPVRFSQGLEEQRSLPKKRQWRGSYLCIHVRGVWEQLLL